MGSAVCPVHSKEWYHLVEISYANSQTMQMNLAAVEVTVFLV